MRPIAQTTRTPDMDRAASRTDRGRRRWAVAREAYTRFVVRGQLGPSVRFHRHAGRDD